MAPLKWKKPQRIKPETMTVFRILLATLCCVAIQAPAQQYRIPVGYDAYRLWDHLPLQRIGVRAYMRSTYARTGADMMRRIFCL